MYLSAGSLRNLADAMDQLDRVTGASGSIDIEVVDIDDITHTLEVSVDTEVHSYVEVARG